MRAATVLLLCSLLSADPFDGEPKVFESRDAYELVAPVAVSVLPNPLRSFLDARMTEIVAVAGQTAGSDASEGGPHLAPCWLRDGTASAPNHSDIDAVLFAGAPQGADVGTLPKQILSHSRALAGAFRARQAGMIAREAGMVIHFATDAALPFHQSRDWAVRRSGSAGESSESGSWNAMVGFRHRFHLVILREMHDRWSFELRVARDRFTEFGDPGAAIRRVIVDAHWARQALTGIYFELCKSSSGPDPTKEPFSSGPFDLELARRAGPLVRGRLEEGALLAAGLIHAAWVEAGRPDVSQWSTGSAVGPKDAAGGPATATHGAAFVGSKSSETFHRTTCQHVDRIRPENLVTFSSPREAAQAGRKACRTCKPDQALPAKP